MYFRLNPEAKTFLSQIKKCYKIFEINWKMGFLYWKSDAAKGGLKEEGHIDLLQVHEILKGFRVAKVAEESNFINRPKNSCLSVYHGSAFNLNVLILYATSDKVADDWIEGLRLRGSKICIQSNLSTRTFV